MQNRVHRLERALPCSIRGNSLHFTAIRRFRWHLALPTEAMPLLQVKQVCNLVARRSAALVAACLAGLLKQIGRDGSSTRMQPTTIAVDGGLFEHYQAYRGYLRTNLDQLLGRQVSCLAQLPDAF